MPEPASRKPSSVILGEAPGRRVTLEWLLGRLGDRSFGMLLLIVAPLGLLPGISAFVGILLVIPACQHDRRRWNTGGVNHALKITS